MNFLTYAEPGVSYYVARLSARQQRVCNIPPVYNEAKIRRQSSPYSLCAAVCTCVIARPAVLPETCRLGTIRT